eukprot:scaffold41177_cov41-Tisochrysis_lutea.AAC.1
MAKRSKNAISKAWLSRIAEGAVPFLCMRRSPPKRFAGRRGLLRALSVESERREERWVGSDAPRSAADHRPER